jgi:hypothetical protein
MGVWGSFMPAGNAVIILIAPIRLPYFLTGTFYGRYLLYFAAGMCFLAYFIIPLDPESI